MKLLHGDSAARIVSGRIAASVATTALLTAIPVKRRVDGMLCLAAATLYRFDGSSTNTGDGVLVPDAGDGRWISVLAGGATDFKDSVRVASTTNLVGTRTGNILLADANGAIAAMDDVTLVIGNRILMKDQTTGADKGIYVITALGAVGAKWSMTRAADFDTSAKVTAGAIIPVSEGTANGNKTWQLTTNDAITLNTTALTFAAVGAAIGVALPQDIGTAAAGSSGNAADEDHVHEHGDQAGALHAGTLHDAASTTVAGFMAAADKFYLDGVHAAAGTGLTDTATQTIQRSEGGWRKLALLGQGGVLTLGTVAAIAGDQITITRTDESAFTYDIVNGGAGAGTLAQFPVSKKAFAKVQFDGTNWALREIGQLA